MEPTPEQLIKEAAATIRPALKKDWCGNEVKEKLDDEKVATKFDNGKLRMDLIPPEFMFALSTILTFGATKYSSRNWENGMPWGRVFAALMRHMWCWWGGQQETYHSFLFGDLDEETKHSHLWHAACCIVFLITFEERSKGRDDRPT